MAIDHYVGDSIETLSVEELMLQQQADDAGVSVDIFESPVDPRLIKRWAEDDRLVPGSFGGIWFFRG